MPTKREQFKGFDNPEILELTWEAINARGIETGDLIALYKVTYINMSLIESLKDDRNVIVMSIIESGQPMFAAKVNESYGLLEAFIVRESQEILKFLYKHEFHFPDLTDADFESADDE